MAATIRREVVARTDLTRCLALPRAMRGCTICYASEMRYATARQVFALLEKETLWELAQRVHELLAHDSIDHAIVGGVAVCLHGYQRNTVDLDLLVEPADAPALHLALEADGLQWNDSANEFRSTAGVAVQFVLAGDNEGPGQPTKFPSPGDPKHITTIEGLPVLSLASLIQSKLACGLGSLRRTHRDFADVVELIAVHQLDGAFARYLHRSVRKEFRVLVRHAAGR